jgi:GNAT superfamily N-acetyltransferase
MSQPFETTVTHLEMTARPTRSYPMPTNRNLSLLRVRDVPLHYYRYLMDRTGRDWTWVNRLRLDDAELSAIVHSPDVSVHVLYQAGAPGGFFEIASMDERRRDLSYFGLMPHLVGTGLGKWFLSAAVDAAWQEDTRLVSVQTCTLDHPAALGLYQKLGFQPVARSSAQIAPLSAEERAGIYL